MTFSKLVTSTHETDKCNDRQGNAICKITPHHMAGVMSGASCGAYLQSTDREASANYCIGVDGDIDGGVPEENRAWTSSSWDNDKNAITIECSDCDDNWNISDATWNALVNLCVDVCQRYGFTLNYTGDASGSLTEHRMFANTECPGEPLHNRMQELADTVNARLNNQPEPQPEPSPEPVSSGFNVGDEVVPTSMVDYDGTPVTSYNDSYTISELNGDRAVLAVNGTVWCAMNTANISKIGEAPSEPSPSYEESISVGDRVIPCSDTDYDGTPIVKWQDTYTVSELNGDRAVLVNDNGDVWCAMHVSDLKRD